MNRYSGPERAYKKDVALFIDFENVYISVKQVYKQNPNFEIIVEKAQEFGRVIISRAYADWYHYQRITNSLYANGIEPVYVPTYYYGQNPQHANAIKNSVDIHMVIDAMRTLYTHDNIETYIFVTGDRDFIPLMNAIRQYGKECIVIGVAESSSSHLAQSADEFYFYHQLSDDIAPQERTQDPYEALVQAIHRARKRNSEPTFATLKLIMQEIMGSFDQTRYKNREGRHFNKFKDFVREAERRGKVKIFSNGTINMVLLPDDKPEEVSELAAEIMEEEAISAPLSVATPSHHKSKGAAPKSAKSATAKGATAKGATAKSATPESASQPEPRVIKTASDLIIEAIHLARRRNNLCTMATLKVLMKEIQDGFDESNYRNTSGQPYVKFKDLVQDAVMAGNVQILTTGTVDEVFLAGEDPQKLSRFANRRRR